jgi:hypothetical protein
VSGLSWQGKAPLQRRVVELLRQRVGIQGQVVETTLQQLAQELGSGFTLHDVHGVIVDLAEQGFFLGPHLSDRQFRGRLL